MPLRDLIDLEAFEQTRRNAVRRLLDERNEDGWWTGELSSSALSTATAVTALALVDRESNADEHRALIDAGIAWLAANQNDDGGWGDTDKSFSNISTTTLVWAAFKATGHDGREEHAEILRRAEARLAKFIDDCKNDSTTRSSGPAPKNLDSAALAEAIARRYGKDRTFSVPILTMTALAGRFGDPRKRETWALVKQLPFELAMLPRSWFGKLNLQVVSYALPALIAIGQVRHRFRPSRNPVARVLRNASRARTLKLLKEIQPSSGGYLEATPLTSFVTMSLAACGFASHPVTKLAVEFLTRSARPDGSWAIDTNLATWVTTLSVNALAVGGKQRLDEHVSQGEQSVIRDWLLDQQYKDVHPYTLAKPGGWAWTDLPGGVPDADDTSGALLALHNLGSTDKRITDSAMAGSLWLMGLQNGDGGIPTFCRGWGKLQFDQSSPDITGHTVRAWAAWVEEGISVPETSLLRLAKAASYLQKSQRGDGTWLPLWFGNQSEPRDENALYGTSRVLPAGDHQRAIDWLRDIQRSDDGWGGGTHSPSSVEETGLAIDALAGCPKELSDPDVVSSTIASGVAWLIEHTQRGTHFDPAPIGFYFAKLWYYEKLYPIIFTVGALERVAALLEHEKDSEST